MRSGCRNVCNHFFSFIAVDGGYSAWSMWSMCSATCGEGVKVRSRICNSPSPRKGGKSCASLGSNYETMTCNEAECPIGTKQKFNIIYIISPFHLVYSKCVFLWPFQLLLKRINRIIRQVEHTPLARIELAEILVQI